MKNSIKISIIATFAAIFGLQSCYDEKMEWFREPGQKQITMEEIPLSLQEKISRYGVLKSYASFPVGVGIDLTLYMTDEKYKQMVNDNFDNITVGYHMKHGAMVNANGALNFTAVDNLMNALPEGMDVFGHTLVWHQNQRASYLLGLIAPTVIPGPAGSNLLSNGDFENDLTGWTSWGDGLSKVEIATDVKVGGEKSLKAVTKSSSANFWDLQVKSPTIPVIAGRRYQISFFIRSEGEGKVRLSFNGMSNGYPFVNSAQSVTTSTTWTEVKYNSATVGESFTATGGELSFQIDLGSIPSMTYYVDNIVVLDLDAAPPVDATNLITNGSFESGEMSGWTKANPGQGIDITSEATINGDYAVKLTAATASTNDWDLQLTSPDITVVNGNQYELSFWIKSVGDGAGRVSFAGNTNNYPYVNGAKLFTTSSTWKRVVYGQDIIQPISTTLKFSFDLGTIPGMVYYIDDIKLINKTTGAAVKSHQIKKAKNENIVIERSAEEKAEIIDKAMKDWIYAMVGHYKNKVKAWDVVNEPMNESGGMRKGDGNDGGDTFHWQDYIGKDYAANAFKYAREAGNANDILFINDYNLEYSISKLDGLIEYVQYIESKGVTIDGIGTQMHISNSSDTTKIDLMFQKLAATGKLIKVSELDIKVNTSTITIEQQITQAEMYRKVVELYMKRIPAAQRYGISVWGVTDADSWITGDAPCLWKGDYTRKVSYKGFADGLAGKDVSKDFKGGLDY